MHRNKNPCALAVFIKRSFTSLWIYTILLCFCAYALFQHLMPYKKANASRTTINKVSVPFLHTTVIIMRSKNYYLVRFRFIRVIIEKVCSLIS